ncbi:MAG: hypothetical protein SynsKO_16910 [Synoicihabitans sp.]
MTKTTLTLLISLICLPGAFAADKLKALILDGQNNHVVWPKSTIMMKQYLEETGLFEVDVARTQFTWRATREKAFLPLAKVGETQDLPEPKPDPQFAPEFADYDVVVSNFGSKAADWPPATRDAFVDYMKNGGGFVAVHAADNSFGDWPEYNRMIGLGGWGGRSPASGPHVYYNNDGKLVRDDSPGKSGKHGARHEFPITVRVADHPITRGMPQHWLTAEDECYATLRGPAEQMTILATGKDQSDRAPTDRHEPMLMVIDYEEGRVFHLTLGHDTPALEGVGFIVSLKRGAEWAATGRVTQKIPEDFPTATQSSSRPFQLQ